MVGGGKTVRFRTSLLRLMIAIEEDNDTGGFMPDVSETFDTAAGIFTREARLALSCFMLSSNVLIVYS